MCVIAHHFPRCVACARLHGSYATVPSHETAVSSLRSALVQLWGDTVANPLPLHQQPQPDTTTGWSWWWSRRSAHHPSVHYLSASLEVRPPILQNRVCAC